MNLFGTKEVVDPIVELQSRSKSIVSVFETTMYSLTDVNAEISALKTKKEDEIRAIEAENQILKTQMDANAKMISKMNDFLN